VLKAQQRSYFEAYALGGDRSNLSLYREGKAQEDSLFMQLRVLAQDLDVDVGIDLAELMAASETWHIQNLLAFAADSVGNALEISRRGYETLRSATRQLDAEIQRLVVAGREEMARARTLQSRLSLGLGILALGATLVVGRFGFRLRELSDEAETGWDEAEAARRETAAVLAATDDGVLGVDLEGRCTSLNRAGVELLGYQEHEIRGRNVHDLLFHTSADGVRCTRDSSPVLGSLAEGRAVSSFDGSVLWRRWGDSFPARWSLRPQVVGGEVRGAVLTFTDMTTIRDKETALRRAIEQREEVVSIVSHDLRNPLGVVIAAADLLIDIPLDEGERKRQTEIIQRSAQRMQSLIEDLLDVARIEARAFVVRPSLEDLAPIVEEARALFADQAERRGVELCFERSKESVRAPSARQPAGQRAALHARRREHRHGRGRRSRLGDGDRLGYGTRHRALSDRAPLRAVRPRQSRNGRWCRSRPGHREGRGGRSRRGRERAHRARPRQRVRDPTPESSALSSVA
jgi:PAS domain S-box-containing protein